LRAEGCATSAVAALSVVVAVLGHVLAGGGSVPLGVVPPLVALMGVCWLLGEYLADERLLSGLVLFGVQLFVHVAMDAAHQPTAMHHAGHESMPMPRGISGNLFMTAAHLVVLLAGVLLISRTHHWAQRIVRILARLVPQLPKAPFPVRRYAAVLPAVPAPRLLRQWLRANVSRRGPPPARVLSALS
jgi:hypothetical protein